jgi:hypothetical protein
VKVREAVADDDPVSAARPDGDPADRDAPETGGAASFPEQDRRRMVDLTRVEAGEPERRAPFRRFVEDDSDN